MSCKATLQEVSSVSGADSDEDDDDSDDDRGIAPATKSKLQEMSPSSRSTPDSTFVTQTASELIWEAPRWFWLWPSTEQARSRFASAATWKHGLACLQQELRVRVLLLGSTQSRRMLLRLGFLLVPRCYVGGWLELHSIPEYGTDTCPCSCRYYSYPFSGLSCQQTQLRPGGTST